MDRGFSLIDSGLGSPAKVVWSYPFDKLKASADDGTRLLFLDFGGDEGEIVSVTRVYCKFLAMFFEFPNISLRFDRNAHGIFYESKLIVLFVLFSVCVWFSVYRNSIWNVVQNQWCLYCTIAYRLKCIRLHNQPI